VIADRGYDHDKYRRLVRQRGIKPLMPRRQTEHGSGPGRYRWVVERTFAWLHNFKRLLVRYERRADMHRALLGLPGQGDRRGYVRTFSIAPSGPSVARSAAAAANA
jgi:transposase